MPNELACLEDAGIKNIVIYVSDSLRWDFTPNSLKCMGVTYKTIASSLYTAASFPSIFSGLYPIKHQVFTWQDILRKQHRGLLDIQELNTALRCENTWIDMGPEDSQIHRLCGKPSGTSLQDIKEPFVYIEDDKGGHCPYGLPFDEYGGGGCFEFFREFGKKGSDQLTKMYKKGVLDSIDNFKSRLNVLKDRGIMDNTLVIFTSDHGELLGEYGGLVNHGRPPCPELVYVPTIFINPKLNNREIKNGVARHVDIYPTASFVLGFSYNNKVDGVNLAKESPTTGFSFQRGGHKKETSNIKKLMQYRAKSVWDYNGGHVFHDLGEYRARFLFYNRIILQNHPEFNYMRESVKNKPIKDRVKAYRKGVDALSNKELIYGKPKFNLSTGKQMLNNYVNNSNIDKTEVQETLQIDKEVEERLKSLGYMD